QFQGIAASDDQEVTSLQVGGLGQAIAKICVREPTHQFALTGRTTHHDVWVTDPVEHRRLDHRVDGHVTENQLVPYLERRVERIRTDDISSKTRHPTQNVGMRFFVGFTCTQDPGTVWHLQHVGHVSRRRNVQHGDIVTVVEHVQDGGNQHAGVERNRLSRLQVNIHTVATPEVTNDAYQTLDVVTGPSDVVPATEIHPLEPRNDVCPTRLESSNRAL